MISDKTHNREDRQDTAGSGPRVLVSLLSYFENAIHDLLSVSSPTALIMSKKVEGQ